MNGVQYDGVSVNMLGRGDHTLKNELPQACTYAIAALVLTGCARPQEPAGLPDLTVVVPGEFSMKDGYCEIDPRGRLLVRIANKGTAPSSTSSSTVNFRQLRLARDETATLLAEYPTYRVDAPPIAPGQIAVVTREFPKGCFAPDCQFSMQINPQSIWPLFDNANYQYEIDVDNNKTFGNCWAAQLPR
jgi:hypothetical protein